MAEVAKADLAASLFDAALAGDQQVLCALEPAFIIVVVKRVAIDLFEEILQFAGAHEDLVSQRLQ